MVEAEWELDTSQNTHFQTPFRGNMSDEDDEPGFFDGELPL